MIEIGDNLARVLALWGMLGCTTIVLSIYTYVKYRYEDKN